MLARWIQHVFRHASTPAYLLLHSQNAAWLRHVRVLNGRSLRYVDGVNAGETCARGESGNVVRWAGRWLEAVGESVPLENAVRDAGRTRELATCLHAILISGRWHGERVLVICACSPLVVEFSILPLVQLVELAYDSLE